MPFIDSTIQSNGNFFGNDKADIPAPAIAAGDNLVAIIGTQSLNIPVTFDAIWTLIAQVSFGGAGPTLAAYRGVAVNPIPASYTFQYPGNETGIMGAIAAYSDPMKVAPHIDSAIVNVLSDPNHVIYRLPLHAVAVDATLLYATYVANIDNTNSQVLTMPPQSVVRENAPWIPADVGLQRAHLGFSEEVLVAANEPARDFDYTWGQVGQPMSTVAMRIYALDAPGAGSAPGFGFGNEPFA